MSIKIQKKDNESTSSFLYRVSQVIQKSGVMLEALKHQNHSKKPNERKKKLTALHRMDVLKEIEYKKKMGLPIKKK
jgi:hypothetical protein